MKLILNGNLLDEDNFSISVQNRAFTYGDGIFETLIGTSKKVRFFEDHLARLQKGLTALQINCHDLFIPGKTEKEIRTLLESNNISNLARIKILVWRKSGGLFSPESNEGEYLIQAIPHKPGFLPKEKVLVYNEATKAPSPLSGFKTISSVHYVLAGIFRKEKEADDVILLDSQKNISECLSSNIFWIKGEHVFTPSLSTACVNGIMRKQLIKKLTEKKITLIEGAFSAKEIMEADFAFTSNVAGLIPILSIEGKKLNATNPLFDLLAEEFNKFSL